MSFLESYKPGQGKTSRTVTYVSGACLIVWAGKALNESLPLFWGKLGSSLNLLMDETIPFEQGWQLDLVVLKTTVSPAFVIAALLILGGLFWWQRFLNRPRWGDMLIDMEGELKKVSWPSASDAWQSTLVVTGCTALLVGLILVYDFVINRFMLLFSGGV